MTHKSIGIKLRMLLLPFSLIYGSIVWVRNKFFDWGWLEEKTFDIPIISVGNITVGGTGKTPLVEYLIGLLKDKFEIATLSRGYKRNTKGYILANNISTPILIGDEPYQMHSKFPKVSVAVCEKRVDGINHLLAEKEDLEIILLDDAYQHRHVCPGISILLIDYNRPIFKDFLLPAGSLRENRKGKRRADIIIITKSPDNISELERTNWLKKLSPSHNQSVFFSRFQYQNPLPLFNENALVYSMEDIVSGGISVLIITGIASPKPLVNYLKDKGISHELLQFSDHHNFTGTDFDKIKNRFDTMQSENKLILTTEKDAVRLRHMSSFPISLKEKAYFLPIKVRFLHGQENEIENFILNYVRKN